MNKIGVLGCGWVGLPLAENLIREGYSVKGTSTSSEKVNKLSKLGVIAYNYTMDEKGAKNSLFFKSIDTLVITIPFAKKHKKFIDFNKSINELVKIIEKESISNVIYLSSISVYGAQDGDINESKSCIPDSINGIQILKIEHLINKGSFITTNIRLGGLIGADRHPINSLTGKRFNKGNEYINLIHQTDVLGILLKVIKKLNFKNVTYNAVSPYHPSKKEYYTQIAIQKKIAPPIFTNQKGNKKIINSSKLIKELGYTFKIKNLLID